MVKVLRHHVPPRAYTTTESTTAELAVIEPTSQTLTEPNWYGFLLGLSLGWVYFTVRPTIFNEVSQTLFF